MAQKVTKQAAPPATVPAKTTTTPGQDKMAAVRAARGQSGDGEGDKFIHRGQVVEGSKKLAPQAQIIANAIEAAGKDGITRKDLVKAITGVLTTRQPESRILSYYQKELVEKGYCTMTKDLSSPRTEKPGVKPAKAAKPAKEDEEETEETEEEESED